MLGIALVSLSTKILLAVFQIAFFMSLVVGLDNLSLSREYSFKIQLKLLLHVFLFDRFRKYPINASLLSTTPTRSLLHHAYSVRLGHYDE